MSRKLVRILTIDGGGTRGILPMTMLRHLERISQTRITDLFDLFAGSSAGGVISLLLTRRGSGADPIYTLDQVFDLFLRDINQIFSRPTRHRLGTMWGLRDHKFDVKSVKSALSNSLGDAELKDVVKDVLLTTYDIDHHRPLFLTRHDARADPNLNFPLAEAARSTMAAPTWFPSVRLKSTGGRAYHVVDGGVYANNPATCAYAEATRLFGHGTHCVIVSLGTGLRPFPTYKVSSQGLLSWGPYLWRLLFDGQQFNTDAILNQLIRSADGASRYFRLQPNIPLSRARVDNVAPSNVDALAALADGFMKRKRSEVEQICELLTKG